MADAAARFLAHRPAVIGLAYRMTGSRAAAEDIAQELYLRWEGAMQDSIALPRAWLMKAAARLALDHLKSAQVRRETYVGPWLPEPVPDCMDAPQEAALAQEEHVSIAILLVLQTLSPAERAAFILHDLFDTPFSEIAGLLHKTEAACRQMALRARQRLGEMAADRQPPEADGTNLAAAFRAAAQTGDETALRALLAADVTLHADGGGVRPAAINVIYGAEKAARMLSRLARKKPAVPELLFAGRINGSPGFVTLEADGLPQATVLDISGGRITAIYIIRNPEKLGPLMQALLSDRQEA